MATVKIDFSDLHDAARSARRVADELNNYANALPGRINSPLSSLTGGQSVNTQNAAAAAQRKAQSLRNRANVYEGFSKAVERFAVNVENTDRDVKRKIKTVADKRADGLAWYQKIAYNLFSGFNELFGATQFGALVHNVLGWGNTVLKMRQQAIKIAIDWFRHGNGKYVMGIVLAGIAIIGAIATIVAGGPAILVALAVVGGIVTIANAIAQIHGNAKAISKSGTEPGAARYYSGISDLKSWAKKETTSKKTQDTMAFIDLVGSAANIAHGIGSLGMVKGADGVKHWAKGKDALKKAVKENIADKFGIKYTDGVRKFEPGAVFGFDKMGKALDKSEKMTVIQRLKDITSPVKNMYTVFETPDKMAKEYQGRTTKKGYEYAYNQVKNVVSCAKAIFPGISIGGDLFGYGDCANDTCKYVKSVTKSPSIGGIPLGSTNPYLKPASATVDSFVSTGGGSW